MEDGAAGRRAEKVDGWPPLETWSHYATHVFAVHNSIDRDCNHWRSSPDAENYNRLRSRSGLGMMDDTVRGWLITDGRPCPTICTTRHIIHDTWYMMHDTWCMIRLCRAQQRRWVLHTARIQLWHQWRQRNNIEITLSVFIRCSQKKDIL